MTRADEYAAAEAWCERERRYQKRVEAVDADLTPESPHATLSARCVRAWAALASGRVKLRGGGNGKWCADITIGKRFVPFVAADPLDAVLAALDAEAGDGK